MSGQKEFLGQLYKADPVTKAWSVMCKGLTTLTLLPMGNKRWRMVASKGTEKVMDEELGTTFKHRVKDTFVQWQQKSPSGASETHGFRTKELSTAQELGAVLDSIVTELEKEATLTILLPDQNRSILKFDKSATMLQVLKILAEKHQFDATQYALATPPEPPSDIPLKLKAAMTVQQLKRLDVMVVSRKKPPKPPQEETIPMEVFLPDDTSYTVHVLPSVSLKELLTMVCSKSSLDPSIHAFDLPIANPPDSLKLQQLKITSIQLIQKDVPKQNQPKESSNSQPQPKGNLKPRKSDAPPPPTLIKPKQLTAGVMKQLKDKMAASSNEGAEEVDRPSPILQTKQSPVVERATPPPNRHGVDAQPVAQKSGRKAPPPPPAQKKAIATDSDDNTPKHSRKITVTRRAPPPPKPLQAKHKSVEEVDSGVQINTKMPSPRLAGRVDPTGYKKAPSPSVSPLATRRIMASDIKQQIQSSPSASKKPSTHRAPPPPPSKKPPNKQPPAQPQPAKVTISPSKEDGGQLLIVSASPSERRRVVSLPGSLVFKLPPPPPKGPGFHSLKRTKKDDSEPAVKILEEEKKDIAEKETKELLEEKKDKESEEEESDVEEEKNDTDLDKSTATSDSDSVAGYRVDSATMLHKEDLSPTTTPPSERDEPFDVQVDGDALFDQEHPSVWHRPTIMPETISSADSDSHSEESSEDEEDDNDGEDGPGIVLLSVQKAETEIAEFEPVMTEPELDTAAAVDPTVPTMLEVPPPPPPPSVKSQEPVDPVFQVALDQLSSLSVAEAIAREEEVQREKNSAELNELDTMLTSLRSLIADTCEIGGKSDGNSKSTVDTSTNAIKTVTPPPSDMTSPQAEEPPVSLGKPSTEESVTELERSSSPSPPGSPPSPPPSPPPPPPLSPPPLDDELEPDDEPVSEAHKPKPPPPTTKPKPVRKSSRDESSELLAKLRRRREKSDVSPAPSKSDESPPPLPQQPPPAAAESSVPGQTPANDNVQMQLQFLQQQVLQQQVMQLQQQFQTFQQAMSSGMPQQQQQQQMLNLMQQMQAAMAQQPAAGYPQTLPASMMFGQQPLMTAPTAQPVPMVQPVMVPPTAGQTPYIMAQPAQQLPIMSTGAAPSSTSLSQPFAATLGTTPVQPLQQPSAPATSTTAPPLATVPATGEQQVPTEVAATPVQKERKTSEADTRYTAMGSAVKKYDDLMQQVRAVDFNELLKPPEDTEEEEETHSSYTGMTAALLEAMQERRKQITSETSFESNSADTSMRQDSHNDSNGWES